jgi:hypothetical protein
VGLNDEAEKLRYAWDVVRTYPRASEAYRAAADHLDTFDHEEWVRWLADEARMDGESYRGE